MTDSEHPLSAAARAADRATQVPISATEGLREKVARTIRETVVAEYTAGPLQDRVGEWRPIETAPKDGTLILAFCVHANARYAGENFSEWTEIVTTRWIDHNGGGWTWSGICGVHTHWQPIPEPPARSILSKPSQDAEP